MRDTVQLIEHLLITNWSIDRTTVLSVTTKQ